MNLAEDQRDGLNFLSMTSGLMPVPVWTDLGQFLSVAGRWHFGFYGFEKGKHRLWAQTCEAHSDLN